MINTKMEDYDIIHERAHKQLDILESQGYTIMQLDDTESGVCAIMSCRDLGLHVVNFNRDNYVLDSEIKNYEF